MYDGIEFRGFEQAAVAELAAHAGVPVWNGLTDRYHPTQIVADLLTMREHRHTDLSEMKLCFVGNAGDNVARSLMVGAAKVGMGFRVAAPKSCWPDASELDYGRLVADQTGATIWVTDRLEEAVRDCDFIYTDVWVSMGESDTVWEERIHSLAPYRVTREVLEMSGKSHVKFMHCLPAFHNAETELGRHIREVFGLSEMEVTDEVFESEASIVFDQAENRMHTIKALLVATLGR
jgi:ornithine carbamoyltransferase